MPTRNESGTFRPRVRLSRQFEGSFSAALCTACGALLEAGTALAAGKQVYLVTSSALSGIRHAGGCRRRYRRAGIG
jgi:hypothetical protein